MSQLLQTLLVLGLWALPLTDVEADADTGLLRALKPAMGGIQLKSLGDCLSDIICGL